MAYIKFDDSKVSKFVHENEVPEMQAMVNAANTELREGTGAGADFRDWLHLPNDYNKKNLLESKQLLKIQNDSSISCDWNWWIVSWS